MPQNSQLRTKPLSIAAEGLTVDGREISEQDILDIVETYNPAMYGARINLDHERDWSGWAAKNLSNVDIPGMLGDVLSVDAKKNNDGVLCLYAVLAPNASFVQLNQADQAVYFSIEINRNFRGTDKTYLVGLAVTDYPASCYTDRVKFSKEQNKDQVSEGADKDVTPITVNFQLEEPDQPSADTPGFFKKLFSTKDDPDMKKEDLAQAMKDALGEPLLNLSTQITALSAKTDKLENHFAQQVDEEGAEDEPGDKEENTEFAQVKQELASTKQALADLNSKLEKLAAEEHSDTTDSEEDPEGDNAQYANLL
ncbi:GPO family capsid scaffolding protein [Pseudoalteromonas sp. CnMc7-15]|uniref:GPO family capsid scaffolding protein n=1 Tax=unclassified Pseudoalteromonas TaxID=194690 RepID=UPI001EF423D6|nr:GPO family capsid scaffolding protein [Pseudoalteromonas sp. CnMc7-15]MCG7567080.1 GPO family capsid scaffolding protein [Pseudoalteromonas sp. CnMc7-15]